MEQAVFYFLAAVVLVTTGLAVTSRHPVHAISWLAGSFFVLAVIFALLGSPLIAVFEVILYAGAILMLLLFVVMMFDLGELGKFRPGMREVIAALVLGVATAAAGIVLILRAAPAASADVHLSLRGFAALLFHKYGLAVEIVSVQLLLALVGALYLGRNNRK